MVVESGRRLLLSAIFEKARGRKEEKIGLTRWGLFSCIVRLSP